jgi:hypothetical protein
MNAGTRCQNRDQTEPFHTLAADSARRYQAGVAHFLIIVISINAPIFATMSNPTTHFRTRTIFPMTLKFQLILFRFRFSFSAMVSQSSPFADAMAFTWVSTADVSTA